MRAQRIPSETARTHITRMQQKTREMGKRVPDSVFQHMLVLQ